LFLRKKKSINGKKVSVNYVIVKSLKKLHHLAVVRAGHQVIVMIAVLEFVKVQEKVELAVLRTARMNVEEDAKLVVKVNAQEGVEAVERFVKPHVKQAHVHRR